MADLETQFEKDYSFADYQWESEWQPYYHNEAEGVSNLDDLLMQFKGTVDSMQQAFKRAETQIGQLVDNMIKVVVRIEEDADDIPSSSTSTPLLATIGPDLEVVPPSPPLIIISDSPSGEAAAPPESPTREAVDLSDSLSRDFHRYFKLMHLKNTYLNKHEFFDENHATTAVPPSLQCHVPVVLGRHATLRGGFSYCNTILGLGYAKCIIAYSKNMPKAP
ncbi:hypothetical protein JHK82_043160 [Glycine max]|nr:hypothetical protein JHK82_043160 [Glycine max]